MPILNCRSFNGYKPYGKAMTCDEKCTSKNIPSARILLIHLGAIGAVVRSTALLKAIHRKHPNCHLTWVTDKPSQQLLDYHPLIDQVMTSEENSLLELSLLEFDFAYVVDKSRKAAAILKKTTVDQVFGFIADMRTGATLPATADANELWEIGLDDHKKFHLNQKSEIQLTHEALALGKYQYDRYSLPLSFEEEFLVRARQNEWRKNPEQIIIGINTGASPTLPYKKMTIENHFDLIQRIFDQGYENIVLLGGAEDRDRNLKIAQDPRVQQSPTTQGLRDGLVSVHACDVVISGDSLGMHMAIASTAYVIAWFGPTCAHEIELYHKGETIKSKASCGPCWKRHCLNQLMCYDQVDLNEIVKAVMRGETFCKNQKKKIHLDNSSIS